MDEVRLLLGDCLEVMKTLDAGSIDAVVTDPPYSIPTNVASGRSITRNVGDLSLTEASFRLFFSECSRVLSPSGRMFVFCDGTSYPVIFRAAYGRWSTALLVWDKQQIGMGREFRKSHELILHCWREETPIVDSEGTGYPDIIPCPPVPSSLRVHPAQKPVKLINSLLRVCGENILDPFCGSGSTGESAMEMRKHFVGIEIDEIYFAIAEKRIRDAQASTPLFDRLPKPARQPEPTLFS